MKFRFVDRILHWRAQESITGIKGVSFEEYSLTGMPGAEAHLPETLLLESFLQLGNWLILLSSDFQQMGMVLRISEVRFHKPVLPGQQVRMQVSLSRGREDGFMLSGEGRVEDEPVISGFGCLAVPVPAKEYVSPDDMRALFSEIYRPPEPPLVNPESAES